MDKIQLDTIPEAIEHLRQGKMIVVVDDEDRENEGDLIGAADLVTPEMINFMTVHARGLVVFLFLKDVMSWVWILW